MTADLQARLVRDPVFQLNAVLWLVQELPVDADVRPILREAGYLLHSVGRRLPFSPALRERLRSVAGETGDPCPDVVLVHQTDPAVLVSECKAASFGSASSTARQPLKLVAVSRDLADPLGMRPDAIRPGYVVYVVPSHDALKLPPTLTTIRARLQQAGSTAAPAAVVGLDRQDDGLYLGPAHGDELPRPAAAVLDTAQRIWAIAPEDDPRPLYLIPWDPSVEQDEDLEAFGKALLGARFLNQATGEIGRLPLPTTTVLRMDQLLEQATLGVSNHWRDRSAIDRVEEAGKRAIVRAIQDAEVELDIIAEAGPHRVQVTITKEEQRNAVIAALEAASHEEALVPESQLSLFEREP